MESFFRNMATSLAWDEKELKMHLPPHSSRTTFSIDLQILVSQIMTNSGLFFFKLWRTFLLLGFRPIEFALKHWILKLVAVLAPPLVLSCVSNVGNSAYYKALCDITEEKTYRKIILYFVLYYKNYGWVCQVVEFINYEYMSSDLKHVWCGEGANFKA